MADTIALKHRAPGPSLLKSWQTVMRWQSDHIEPMRELVRDYGDVCMCNLGIARIYFMTQPELVQEVLVTRHREFHKDPYYNFLRLILGNGLLTSEDDFHLRQRRMIQPAFHRQRVHEYGLAMVRHTQELAATWKDGAHIDINRDMMRLALAIVGETLFSSETDADAERVAEALDTIFSMEARYAHPYADFVSKLPLPGNALFQKAIGEIDKILYRMIAEHRASGDRGDLLSMLLAAVDEDGAPMPDKQIRDEAITLFLAGHETTAVALTWTFYLLSQNPDVEARLHEELDTVLGDNDPSPEDYSKLDYTYRVFKEAMRLYPPAYVMGREPVEDTQVGVYHIPKKSMILLSPYLVQRDPRNFPDPERFDPDRWLPENCSGLHKFAYFPFGGGKRLCVGEPFAWMEGVLVVATLARQWKFRVDPTHPIGFTPAVTLRPKNGMPGTIHKR